MVLTYFICVEVPKGIGIHTRVWSTIKSHLFGRMSDSSPFFIFHIIPFVFRLLEHKNIAVFFGIQHSDSYLPAMVYKEHLHTLRHHILKRSKHLDIPGCVQEIVAGMEYLHKNGMVHMELNTNTVMVCIGWKNYKKFYS